MHEISVDADRLVYLRLVIEGYMSWRRESNKLGFPQSGRVIGIAEPIENRRLVDLNDDDFTLIDQRFTRLDPYDRALLDIEYNDSGSPKQKAKIFSVSVLEYRGLLADAEIALYDLLMPHLEAWERAKPVRRRSA